MIAAYAFFGAAGRPEASTHRTTPRRALPPGARSLGWPAFAKWL